MRITTVTIIAVAGLLATGSYGWANSTTDSSQSQASNDRDTIVCKAGSAPTGSHLPGPRECRTKAQRDDIQMQSHDALQDLQNRTLQENKSGG